MNEDYLSPFNDDFIISIQSLQDSMKIFLKSLEPIQEAVKPLQKIINEQYTLPTSQVSIMIDNIKNLPIYNPNDKVLDSLKNIREYVVEMNSLSINHLNLEHSFDLLLKDNFINPSKNIQNQSFPINSKSEVYKNIETKKIQALREACFKFAFACKRFKESFDFKHNISSPVDRILSNFGFSSAISELLSLIKPNDPLFTIMIFFIIGVFQEIFKKE